MARNERFVHRGPRTTRFGAAKSKGRPRGEVVLWALGALIVVAPHLLGGIFAWTSLLMTIAATVLAATAAWASHSGASRVEPIALVLGLLVCITVAQAMPLPLPIANLLAPDSVHHTSQTYALLDQPAPSFVALSLDPGRTHERTLYATAVWAVFCVALMGSSRRPSAVLTAVALSGVFIALSDLGHLLCGATRVYGLYRPEYIGVRGPLLNPNNLAGMLALTTPVCLGLAARSSTATARSYWLLAALLTGATCINANSRGGTAALAAGVTLFALLWWRGASTQGGRRGSRKQSSKHDSVSQRLGLAIIPVVVLIASFVLAHSASETPLDTNYGDLSKFDLFKEEARFLFANGRHLLLGIGRGALPAVFSPAGLATGRVMHAENFALQFALDFGLPIALGVVAYMAVRVVGSLLRWRSPTQLGGLCGCLAIGLQNLVDFGLELTGVAIPAAACLAASLPSPSSRRNWPSTSKMTWLSASAGTLVVLLFGSSAVRNDAYVVQSKLQAQVKSPSSDFWPLYRSNVLAHPADNAFAVLGAARKVYEGKRDAWPWLERAIALAPEWGAPRVLAARWLLQQGEQDEALAALAEAAERDPRLALRTLCEWLGRAPYAQVVWPVVPREGASRVEILDGSAGCLQAPAEAAKIDAVLLKEEPSHLRANLRALRRQLDANDAQGVTQGARALQSLHPTESEPYRMEARAWLALAQPAEAVRALEAGLTRIPNHRSLLADLLLASARAGDAERMRDTAQRLRGLSNGDPKSVAQALHLLARGEAELGNYAQSLRAARDAYETVPDPGSLALAASAAEKLGHHAFALRAWKEACREAPEHPTYCRAHERLTKILGLGPQPTR